jgi:hypothetical protein
MDFMGNRYFSTTGMLASLAHVFVQLRLTGTAIMLRNSFWPTSVVTRSLPTEPVCQDVAPAVVRVQHPPTKRHALACGLSEPHDNESYPHGPGWLGARGVR